MPSWIDDSFAESYEPDESESRFERRLNTSWGAMVSDRNDITKLNENDLKLLIEKYGIDLARAQWIFKAIEFFKKNIDADFTPIRKKEYDKLIKQKERTLDRIGKLREKYNHVSIGCIRGCQKCRIRKDLYSLYEMVLYGR